MLPRILMSRLFFQSNFIQTIWTIHINFLKPKQLTYRDLKVFTCLLLFFFLGWHRHAKPVTYIIFHFKTVVIWNFFCPHFSENVALAFLGFHMQASIYNKFLKLNVIIHVILLSSSAYKMMLNPQSTFEWSSWDSAQNMLNLVWVQFSLNNIIEVQLPGDRR